MRRIKAIVRPFGFISSSSPGKVAALATLGAVIGSALTPFMDAVWVYEPGIEWSKELFVNRTLGPLLESSGLLTFGRQATADRDGLPYEVYGKGFFLVYLLMLPVVRAARPVGQHGQSVFRMSVWAWRAMYVAIWVAMVCDFISYWGKSVPGDTGDVLWSVGGGTEILTIFVLLGTTLLFGVSGWIARALTRWVSAVLIAAVLAVIPVNLFITGYWPNSFVVPVSIGWAVIAAIRLSTGRKTAAASAA